MSHILKGDILYIPRVAGLPDEQPDKDLLQAGGIQSLLAVPITSRERVIGLIGLDAVFAEHRWREETIALLKIVGAVFGNAIERMRADQVLLRERDFIANVIETAPSLILVLTPDGRCTRANRAFRDLTGLSTADLYETGWQKVIPEESREAARQALRTTMGGVPAQFEGALL